MKHYCANPIRQLSTHMHTHAHTGRVMTPTVHYVEDDYNVQGIDINYCTVSSHWNAQLSTDHVIHEMSS